MSPSRPPTRLSLLVCLAIVTPLGFASKFTPGPGAWWFNDYAGGLLYEVFWVLVVMLVRPTLPVVRVAWVVFGVTSALEFLQLWDPPPLAAIRRSFLSRTLIGTTFGWWDFVHYAAGCAVGVFLVRRLGARREAVSAATGD